MNRKLLDYVLNDAIELNGSRLLVMLCLATFADDEGVCHDSVALLAKRVRLSEKQTRRVIHRLARDGYLAIERIDGHANRYTVNTKGN